MWKRFKQQAAFPAKIGGFLFKINTMFEIAYCLITIMPISTIVQQKSRCPNECVDKFCKNAYDSSASV